MTKSQCYAEIAQKQSEIANYNTKIEKLNSEILELNQVKSSISSLQGSFSECKNSGTSKLENTGAVQKINSKFTSKFMKECMIYIMVQLFGMLPADWIKRLSVLHWRLQENRMK